MGPGDPAKSILGEIVDEKYRMKRRVVCLETGTGQAAAPAGWTRLKPGITCGGCGGSPVLDAACGYCGSRFTGSREDGCR